MVGKSEFKRDRKKPQNGYKKHFVVFININGDQFIIRYMMETYFYVNSGISQTYLYIKTFFTATNSLVLNLLRPSRSKAIFQNIQWLI